jgi:hypothetical protein
MRLTVFLLVAALLAGCATHRDDARLQGTWTLNRYAAAAPSNALPRVIYVNYSHGAEIVQSETQYGYRAFSFHYHVVEQGSNYIVIHTTAFVDKGRDIRIRFVDADKGYWINTWPLGFEIQERFDKLQSKPTQPLPPGMGGVIPPPVIRLD